jgi:hypothetical protein
VFTFPWYTAEAHGTASPGMMTGEARENAARINMLREMRAFFMVCLFGEGKVMRWDFDKRFVRSC